MYTGSSIADSKIYSLAWAVCGYTGEKKEKSRLNGFNVFALFERQRWENLWDGAQRNWAFPNAWMLSWTEPNFLTKPFYFLNKHSFYKVYKLSPEFTTTITTGFDRGCFLYKTGCHQRMYDTQPDGFWWVRIRVRLCRTREKRPLDWALGSTQENFIWSEAPNCIDWVLSDR